MKISSLSLLAPNNPLDDTSFGLITQRIAANSKAADFLFCSCQKEDKHTVETFLALCTNIWMLPNLEQKYLEKKGDDGGEKGKCGCRYMYQANV